ncbi:MAG: hypothetical protein ACRCX2_08115 [Paraclostridium sp.]
MTVSVQVKDDRKKLDKILKNFDNCNFEDYIGLMSDLDTEATEKGLFNEFGTSKAPSRPFVEPTYINNEKWIIQQVEKGLRSFRSPRAILNIVSLKMVEKIRHKIDTMKYPKLAESTVKKKGHGKLLKDSYDMYSSIKTIRIDGGK